MVERGEEREGREEEGGEREVAGLEEIGREEDAGGQEQGHRRSARGHARRDAARSEGAEAARREERESRRARAREGEERTESRATDRETGRAAAAARIVALARRDGRELVEELREVGGIGRIKERWRWSVSPTGEREQVVLFNHGQEGGQEDQEVRAVILESQYGRGLYYASAASKGRELSFYDGVQVTREEYVELDEFTGLRHTLEIGGGGRVVNGLRGGRLINGIHGVTGMQYANTSRGGAEANNADFTGTAMVRVSASGGVERGQPVLLPYDWSAAAWEEIDSKVVGVCAYEEKGGGQGLGDEGGTFVVELATALRKGGLAAQLIREARAGWGKGQGRTELQVHMGNRRARAYYERLGMRRCRWWEEGRADEGPRLQGDHGGSLYEPRAGFQMMQVGPEELEAQLARRGAARAPTAGVEYVRATGVRGLREAGLLKGVRAMMARVYGGEEWYVNDEEGEGRVECLYEKKRKGERRVKFVVARLVDSDRWVATAAEAEETGTEAEVGVSGGPETPTTAAGAAAATPEAAAVAAAAAAQGTTSSATPAAAAVAVSAAAPATAAVAVTVAAAVAVPAAGPAAVPVTAGVAVSGTDRQLGGEECGPVARPGDRQDEGRGVSASGQEASTSGQRVLTSGRGGVRQRTVDSQGRAGDQAGGQHCGQGSECTTALGQEGEGTGLGGGEMEEEGRERKRRRVGQAEGPEGERKGGTGRKRGRQDEGEGEDAGGGKRQDRELERQRRKKNRGDG